MTEKLDLVLDTNVIVDYPEIFYEYKEPKSVRTIQEDKQVDLYQHILIYDFVLKELDSLEHTTRNNNLKYKIRQAKKVIDDVTDNLEDYKGVRFVEGYDDIQGKNYSLDVDSHLIKEIKERQHTMLLTQDIMLKARAAIAGIEVRLVDKRTGTVDDYEPIITLKSPDDDELITNIYENPNNFDEDLFKEGQYIEIISDDGKHSDEMKYSKGKIINLNTSPIGDKYFSKPVKAINARQKFALDMMNDEDKLLSVIKGSSGSGKTLIAMSKALQDLNEKQRKIIFIKNNIPVKGAPEIGFLPGTEQDKTKNLADSTLHVLGSRVKLENLLGEGDMEIVNLSNVRGIQYSNATIVIDEGQNIPWSLYKTILTRMGDNSRVIITLDEKQIDLPNNSKSGIDALRKFKDSEIFNTVILDRVERSEIARLAEELL